MAKASNADGSAYDDVQLRIWDLRHRMEVSEPEKPDATSADEEAEEDGGDERSAKRIKDRWWDRDRAVAAALRKVLSDMMCLNTGRSLTPLSC